MTMQHTITAAPQPPTARVSGLADPAAAALYLGVAPKTLANWRAAGRGPAYSQLGGGTGLIRYAFDDLDNFIAASRRDPNLHRKD